MKYLLIILLFITNFSSLNSQGWKVIWKTWQPSDTIFDLRKQVGLNQPGYLYPIIEEDDNNLSGAYNPFKKSRLTNNKLYSKININRFFNSNPCSVVISLKLFLQNIKSFEITFRFNDSITFFKKYNVSYEGYQEPIIELLNSWDSSKTSNLLHKEIYELESITIEADPVKKHFDFSFNELLILVKKDIQIEVEHPFFSFLNGKQNYVISNSSWENSSDQSVLLIKPFSLFAKNTGSQFYLTKKDGCATEDEEKKLLLEVFEHCLIWYPFYKERNIKKDSILSVFQRISIKSKGLSLSELSNNLSSLINKFNDGHFKLEVSPSQIKNDAIPSHLRITEINGKFYIAAVFDKQMMKYGILGKEIIAIDNKRINTYLDSLSNMNEGEYSISNCLNRKLGDSVLVHFINNKGDVDSLFITNNTKLIIPENFKPKQADFKYHKNVSYFKINSFNPGIYLRFLNHYDSVRNSKGLIFDLRGNGGGNSLEAMRIFSMFIDHPVTYSNELDKFNEMESIIVKPSERYKLHIPTIILIDNNTACSSEAFAENMRFYNSSILVGKSKTSGTYASLYELFFPSGNRMKINCIQSKIFTASNQNIEGRGINPDIWVKIIDVYDLYPYNDKVLKIAVILLDSVNNKLINDRIN